MKIQSGGTPLTELYAGNVDIARIAMKEIPSLDADEGFNVYYGWSGNQFAIYWNQRLYQFKDASVRKALTMAIDRKEYLRFKNLPDSVPIIDVPLTKNLYLNMSKTFRLSYDPEQAGRLLSQAGWKDRDGDGIREKEGQKLSFTVLVDKNLLQDVIFIQDQLRRVGAKMEIQTMTYSLVKEKWQNHDFEACIWKYGFLSPKYQIRSMRVVGYRNSGVFQRIRKALKTWDPAERDRLYMENVSILLNDSILTALPNVFAFAVNSRVHGLVTPFRIWPTMSMEYLWIVAE